MSDKINKGFYAYFNKKENWVFSFFVFFVFFVFLRSDGGGEGSGRSGGGDYRRRARLGLELLLALHLRGAACEVVLLGLDRLCLGRLVLGLDRLRLGRLGLVGGARFSSLCDALLGGLQFKLKLGFLSCLPGCLAVSKRLSLSLGLLETVDLAASHEVRLVDLAEDDQDRAAALLESLELLLSLLGLSSNLLAALDFSLELAPQRDYVVLLGLLSFAEALEVGLGGGNRHLGAFALGKLFRRVLNVAHSECLCVL